MTLEKESKTQRKGDDPQGHRIDTSKSNRVDIFTIYPQTTGHESNQLNSVLSTFLPLFSHHRLENQVLSGRCLVGAVITLWRAELE